MLVQETFKNRICCVLPMRYLIAITMLALIFLSACGSELNMTSSKKDSRPVEWCVSGAQYSKGSVNSVVSGFESFKGKQYCKASASLEAEGQRIFYDYYYNQDGSDVWVVIESPNGTTETHLTN